MNLSAGFGYNSDARSFNSTSQELDLGENTMFGHLGVDAGYAVISTASNRLTLGYELQSDTDTRRQSHADLLDQYFYVEYGRALTRELWTSLRVSDDYTLIGGQNFRNEVAARGRWIGTCGRI